ncbi:hypothetical protein [Virgibacillus salexigens]|uniref:hypothetical protein n=1 Tax=Virgibacillus salexigens TaxID=61016 RepID=UPI00190DDB06|nr:hypothetical protein [Virgibacillus salexigens]
MPILEKDVYLKDLLLFYPYLKKQDVISKLRFMHIFPEFRDVYSKIREKNKKDDTSHIIAKVLSYGIDNNIVTINELDELLFLLLEDSLFNSYIYRLDHTNITLDNQEIINEIYQSWELPSEKKILNNVNKTTNSRAFTVCGYREQNNRQNHSELESLRLLLLDKETVLISNKDGSTKESVYPTIVEIDFKRNLLHIRLKDVDNIINSDENVRTMSGRVNNTLNFIDSFNPHINYSNFEDYRTSLYKLEENLLKEKRNKKLILN